MWLATWFLQVMPIFFFVGGFSNMVTYDSYRRRGLGTGAFVRSRIARLLRPSVVFLGIWVVLQVGLHLADVGSPAGPRLWDEARLLRGMLPPAATLPFGPLWFLGAYLVVVSVSPFTIGLHRRFGLRVPTAMVVGTIVVDVVGFGLGVHGLRYMNVAFVLLLPHQLGHFYADGSLARAPKRVFWAMVAAGLGALVLLTNPWVFRSFGAARFDWFPTIGHYPKSLLGTDVEPISNAYPPTVCFMAAAIWAVGAVMLLRPIVSEWLRRPAPWRAVISVNGVIMTLFLWHMTAYLIVILALWPLGFGRQADSTLRWWLERPLWIGVPGVILAGLVVAFGRFERPAVASTSAAVGRSV
jgi:acyltransferase-like protein